MAVDDALQTAAERALSRADPFDSIQGWINWTIKVAWHEVQAQWRRDTRSVLGEPVDTPGGQDPALIVERHLEMEATFRGLVALSEPDRRAILDALRDGRLARPLAAQEKMRRYRARRRLAALLTDWSENSEAMTEGECQRRKALQQLP